MEIEGDDKICSKRETLWGKILLSLWTRNEIRKMRGFNPTGEELLRSRVVVAKENRIISRKSDDFLGSSVEHMPFRDFIYDVSALAELISVFSMFPISLIMKETGQVT